MGKAYYTVDQIAKILRIHPKTIQRYIREGKLRAAKIGKSWRVGGHDLSLFVESAEKEINLKSGPKGGIAVERVKVSSVIDIEDVDSDEAARIVSTLNAALNTKPPEYGWSTMHTQYLEAQDKVRVTLWGNIAFIGAMLEFISALSESGGGEY